MFLSSIDNLMPGIKRKFTAKDGSGSYDKQTIISKFFKSATTTNNIKNEDNNHCETSSPRKKKKIVSYFTVFKYYQTH